MFNALVVALLLTSPLAAHHSLVGYENRNLVSVTGTVTRVDWFNPHVMVYLSVKGYDGKVTTQHVQIAAVGALKKRGIDKNPFAIGSTVLFEVWVPKDPNNVFAGRNAQLSDGTRLDVSDNWERIVPR